MAINGHGKIVDQCWYDLPNHYPNLILDNFIIMPNHIHGIMIINNPDFAVETGRTGFVETGLRPVSTNTNTTTKINSSKINHGLSEFVLAVKSFSTRKINENRNSKYPPIWQSRFYEHIIRNEQELQTIRYYIIYNPINWKNDQHYAK